ncbi:hypothetical protein HPB49_002904 [Dermacentor silvarum]|uniref:Uncharacterized protein n=1 Tax=Dermacentor silvarum TaxID=543639 RepID=A0ACB8D227_DERSI|nr:hypothetical protein HPB49_002904 [Dermacentor silvarum]
MKGHCVSHFQERGPYYCCLSRSSPLLECLHSETSDFKRHFRITRESFWTLKKILWGNVPTTHGWCRELRLLVFLFWLGCGAAFRVVAACFNIPRTTTFRMVTSVLKLMVKRVNKMVYFPKPECLPQIEAGFCTMSKNDHFDGFVGAIDGCHIRIQAPAGMHQDYFNRKQFYSIQLQAVCDHHGIFIDIFVGFPGSVHDTRVLKNSPIYTRSLYPPPGYAILGDSGYPNIAAPIVITTPYKDATRPTELRFNAAHARARSVVERAFGLMKGRWRSVFTKALEVSVYKAPDVVAACAAMHNVCMRMGDIAAEELVEDDNGVDDVEDNTEPPSQDPEAAQRRDHVAAKISCPVPSGDHDYHKVV